MHLPVLLVDGYNVLHRKWQLRQDAEACPLNLEDEREALVNDTRDYALSLSCRPIVVFDAMANRSPLVTPRCDCSAKCFSCSSEYAFPAGQLYMIGMLHAISCLCRCLLSVIQPPLRSSQAWDLVLDQHFLGHAEGHEHPDSLSEQGWLCMADNLSIALLR